MTQRFSSSSHEKKTPKPLRRSWRMVEAHGERVWRIRKLFSGASQAKPLPKSPRRALYTHSLQSSQAKLWNTPGLYLAAQWTQGFSSSSHCTSCSFDANLVLDFAGLIRVLPVTRLWRRKKMGKRYSEDDDVVKIKLRPLWKNKWVLRSDVNCNGVQRSIETFTVFGWSRWLILTKEEGTWYDCTGLVHSDHEVQNFVPGDKTKQQ